MHKNITTQNWRFFQKFEKKSSQPENIKITLHIYVAYMYTVNLLPQNTVTATENQF